MIQYHTLTFPLWKEKYSGTWEWGTPKGLWKTEFWGGLISQVCFYVLNRPRDWSSCPYFTGCPYFSGGLKDRFHCTTSARINIVYWNVSQILVVSMSVCFFCVAYCILLSIASTPNLCSFVGLTLRFTGTPLFISSLGYADRLAIYLQYQIFSDSYFEGQLVGLRFM